MVACADDNPALLPPAFLLSALFPAPHETTNSLPELALRDADAPPAIADTIVADMPISRVDSAAPALPSLEFTPETTEKNSVIQELEPPIVPVASLSPTVRALSAADMPLLVFDLDPAATITPPCSSNISPASSPPRIGEQTGLALAGLQPPRVVLDHICSTPMDHVALAATQVPSPPIALAPLPASNSLRFTRFDLVAPHDPTYTHFELFAPQSPTEPGLPPDSTLASSFTKKLATALVTSISESLAAFPTPLPGTDPNLAVLAMVLPYVFDVMAVAPSVTERALYAAGIDPFQGLDLAALVAKINEFEKNVPLSLVRLPTTTAGIAARSASSSSRRRAADAVVKAPAAKKRRVDDPVGDTSVPGSVPVPHPHAAYHALFPAVMQQFPQCDAIGAVAQACVAYACERRLAFSEFQQVLVMGLPVLAEAYERLRERRVEK
ncbi:hypothetical protein AMAG_17618 [Allomyces macrogynus ATCC 38327]|uniref:Uncharacterized protein n=1 Tax=Allomyces macrogynus (strain ATCC 38327) TaxID=578462 RepID=A0A0L0RVB5_ALLM3|nr:hypothetical protein AMAG_17618 [Allomyces macrogynus ATCC 38327]|eukprot:KNE54074.1 hypothetical protein AMAG_17618 [Allomyces macrogynus ATCC 38327]